MFEIHVKNPTFSEELLQAYYQEAFEDGPCASQGFKSMYQHLQVRSQGEELIISGPSSVDTEHHPGKTICQIFLVIDQVWFSSFSVSGRS